MKTLIFNIPGSTLYFPSTDWVFQGSNLVNFEAPTSRAPTLSSKAPTLSILRHQPQRLQPYLPGHQPCLYEAPISCFISSRYIWLYLRLPMSSSTSPVNLHLVFIVVSTLRHQCLLGKTLRGGVNQYLLHNQIFLLFHSLNPIRYFPSVN